MDFVSEVTKMAFCSNCGNKLEDGARFCPRCGAPIGVGDNSRFLKVMFISALTVVKS